MKKMVIGLGTGRCGTMSLSHLLDKQAGFDVTHETEHLPWVCSREKLHRCISSIQLRSSAACAGDVAFYYLPYVNVIAEMIDVRFICLWREKRETVESFLRKLDGENPFVSMPSCGFGMSDSFPKYEMSLKAALEFYWDKYYEEASRLASSHFRLWPTSILNDVEGQKQILEYVGIIEPTYVLPIRLNACK